MLAACSVDVRSLAAFRILLGVIVLVDAANRFVDAGSRCPAQTAIPASSVPQWPVSPYRLVETGHGLQAMLAASALPACMLIVGYRTRAASIACWLMLLWLHHRNPLVLQGGDYLLIALVFWSMFLPLDAAWSVRARSSPPTARSIYSEATAALLLQVCLMYFFAGLHKLGGRDWASDGTAVFYALSRRALVTSFGERLLAHPGLLQALSYGTVALELGAPFALWASWRHAPARLVVLASLATFHLGLALCLHLGLFPWICIVGLAPFIPSRLWDLRRGEKPPNPTAQRTPMDSWTSLAIVSLMLYVTALNVATLRFVGSRPRVLLKPGGYVLGLAQNWSLYAPNPIHEDGWHEATGVLAEGGEINLLFPGRAPDVVRPSAGAYYPNMRWRKLLVDVGDETGEPMRPHLVDHFRSCFDGLRDVRVVYHYQPIDAAAEPGLVVDREVAKGSAPQSGATTSPAPK